MNKKELLEQSMTRIEYIRSLQEAYLTCTHFLQSEDRDYKKGDGKVFTDLMKAELDEWRNVMMWGLVCDQKTVDRVKAAAYERFLSEKMHVAHWFHDGASPTKWLSSNEEEFRAMLKETFKTAAN